MIDIKMIIKFIFVVVMTCLSVNTVYADVRLIETRYCGEPVRSSNGKIKRSRSVIREFERLHPLPAEYNRNDWQIDHVIPLKCSGCDSVSNMTWLPKSIKTAPGDIAKDRWEMKVYCKEK